MKRKSLHAFILAGLASAASAGIIEIGGTGNSWSQKPWCGY